MACVFVKTYDAPPYDIREILRYAGARCDSSEIRKLCEDCLEECKNVFRYSVCFSYYPITVKETFIDLGFMRTTSAALRKNLEGCDGIWLFAATVGIESDRLIARYSRIEPSRALLFEAVGSERVEALCDAFCHEIAEKEAADGRITHPRFSAGYGDFPLEAQKEIFDVLEPHKYIGLSLGKNLLMTPQKSVTALIGVGSK